MPSKIHESQAAGSSCPVAGSGLLPAVAVTTIAVYCGRATNGRNGNGSGSGKFRTVKSFVAARALESFAEIQINKMQHENCNLELGTCNLQLATRRHTVWVSWLQSKVFYGYWALSK